MMAVALKGKPGTLFIGEPTAGLTTMNVTFTLGKHTLAVAASIIADRNGKVYRGSIVPDVEIKAGDDFNNLWNDTKVTAALNWMKAR
jgi:carboxyl-terminal processing protease